MFTYKAAYKFLKQGVHAEVIDFPGVISSGRDLEEARRQLAGALVDMAETNLSLGESLPTPDKELSDAEADLEEPIHLMLTAASKVKVSPDLSYEAA